MKKLVEAVLKKLLNGYSVIPVYYDVLYMYYSKNKCNPIGDNYSVNSVILSMTLNSIVVCLCQNICFIVFISYY